MKSRDEFIYWLRDKLKELFHQHVDHIYPFQVVEAFYLVKAIELVKAMEKGGFVMLEVGEE